MAFELLDHTSDIGVLGRGNTREEALIAVSQGMSSILVDPSHIRPHEERSLRADGHDDAAQVVNWLTEILFFFDTESLVLVEFVIDSWTEEAIIGRARGETFDRTRHTLRTALKAATYHQFECRPTEHAWEIRVFLDV